ncbi:hypothetical protein TCAL_08002 [Tigriopus californicus]|uniref:Protein TEX261 n=1 Tax=Tigriopus californicus TaxID=6832 RepID=A0A553PGE3_TIGCA|nr:protein TEX261-like [Tigriopus californicus]TRY76746.1 hypothetical protein TCAL_08002 [Tigriopus californicus]|eukprot:TCALIF_08002-PA protein Name:"Similar to Tex261 Protein TEX261 (Rattus norvegicus)" AED:0.01 eAED:0.01 QI:472/1/1/1/0/0/6/446/201
MWFFYALSWVSTLIQIIFVTLAIAAGLYYLAELVEEYTVLTARIIRWITWFTIIIYLGLYLFEDLTLTMTVCGLISQILHLILLNTFPFFALSSPPFILDVALVLVNHYLAFQFFGENFYPFTEVMAYFTLCLWLVPFAFFVSLSANENVLPTLSERRPLISDENDVVSNYFQRKEKKYGLLAAFNAIKESVLPTRTKKSF